MKSKVQVYKSTCCYCGVGCGVEIIKSPTSSVIEVRGDVTHPVNKGELCSKGITLHYTVNDHKDRLLYPMMRWSKSHELERISWNNAIERAAKVFSSIIDRFGPDAVAFYVSGQCTIEEYYVINKLAKGFIGTNNIDTNSRLCMSSAVAGYKMAFGEDIVPGCYDDLDIADVILVIGANPAWCHPILWRRIEKRKQNNDPFTLIVVDPRRTSSAEIADIHVPINPGTDVIFLNAIGRCLIEQNKIDTSFVTNHTNGFENYKTVVFRRTLEEAGQLCGISKDTILQIANSIGNARGFVSLWAMGLNQSVIGVSKNTALLNLHLLTGQIGRSGAGPFSLTGQPNAMGGREVGGMANLLPHHREITNPEHRQEVARFWGGKEISPRPGYTATELIDAMLDDRVKAVWVICTNPLISMPQLERARSAFRNVRFLIVQDMSTKNQLIPFADLVLPAATWAEKEGTMTNSERRITYLPAVCPPPGEARPDAEIIIDFARAMGFEDAFKYKHMEDVFNEHARLSRGTHVDISGLTYEILKTQRSVQWPFPAKHQLENGTSRLFLDKQFYTPTGKAQFIVLDDFTDIYQPTSEYPFILTTGRVRDQWHTMTRTGKVNKLLMHHSEPYVEIHPQDAAKLKIQNHDLVEIKTPYGQCRLKAQVSTQVKPGNLFVPMHWGNIKEQSAACVNNLTKNIIDPISKEPDFKFNLANITKYQKKQETIVVIGAGAASYAFIKKYRSLNQTDNILVLNKEKNAFYDRPQLPDYLASRHSNFSLQKFDSTEWEELNVTLINDCSIEKIDRIQKLVFDNKGNSYKYEKLLIATGSRARYPSFFPQIDGIFTVRSLEDAQRIKEYLSSCRQVVVIGGGLLGIEIAGALCDIKEVTLLHRTGRLMERQLDILASELLFRELVNRGIKVLLNEEIEHFPAKKLPGTLVLKSGKKVWCDALIVAIGTEPNVTLAQSCNISVNRGIVVNEYLQTSDPDIFAIGECAEFNGNIWGTTLAAEEQGEIAARYLSGDVMACYEGSLFMNILKLNNYDVVSLGQQSLKNNDIPYEEIVFIDKTRGIYKKCVIHNDRLVSAILMGDNSELIQFRELISKKLELGDKRKELLSNTSRKEAPIGKIICSCNNVGEGNIIQITQKYVTLEDVYKITGAGMGCGSCRTEVKKIYQLNLPKTVETGSHISEHKRA
ncbi:MAG: molybdopterin-dependent oxidoreductase [Bacteroidales bacterium]